MSKQYRVFLSHNSKDKAAVERFAHRLHEAGMYPFLDTWNLIAGDPWQEAIEKALDDCNAVIVFFGPSGIGPWHNEEMRKALDARVRRSDYRVVPVLLPGYHFEEELPPFIKRLTWVDFRNGIEDPEAFNRLLDGIKGRGPKWRRWGDTRRKTLSWDGLIQRLTDFWRFILPWVWRVVGLILILILAYFGWRRIIDPPGGAETPTVEVVAASKTPQPTMASRLPTITSTSGVATKQVVPTKTKVSLPTSTPVPIRISANNASKLELLQTVELDGAEWGPLILSPNSKTIADVQNGNTILLWDAQTGRRLRTIRETDEIDDVSFSLDGSLIASAAGYFVNVWRVSDGELIHSLEHSNTVGAVVFSPDNQTLISASLASINIWQLSQETVLQTLNGHTNTILSLDITSDGRYLASSAKDGHVIVWDIESGTKLQNLTGHEGSVDLVRFSQDGSLIGSVSDDEGIARVWSVSNGTQLYTFGKFLDPVYDISFSSDNSLVAVGFEKSSPNNEDRVELWELPSKTYIMSLPSWLVGFTKEGTSLALSAYSYNLWGVVH